MVDGVTTKTKGIVGFLFSQSECLNLSRWKLMDIIWQYSTLFGNIRHHRTISCIILHFSTIFNIFWKFDNIQYYSTIFNIIRRNSILFDAIRHFSTADQCWKMSRSTIFTVELCRGRQKMSRHTRGGGGGLY